MLLELPSAPLPDWLAERESWRAMTSRAAILVCDRDREFCAVLCNFLLSSGYAEVERVTTIRESLPRLRSGSYAGLLFGLLPTPTLARRLTRVVRERQPNAVALFMIRAVDASSIQATDLSYVLKERAFSTLAELLPDPELSRPRSEPPG